MSNRTIRIIVEDQPDLYEELTTAMLYHGEYQGCYIEQYTEYPEDGQTLAKFTLRERKLE